MATIGVGWERLPGGKIRDPEQVRRMQVPVRTLKGPTPTVEDDGWVQFELLGVIGDGAVEQ